MTSSLLAAILLMLIFASPALSQGAQTKSFASNPGSWLVNKAYSAATSPLGLLKKLKGPSANSSSTAPGTSNPGPLNNGYPSAMPDPFPQSGPQQYNYYPNPWQPPQFMPMQGIQNSAPPAFIQNYGGNTSYVPLSRPQNTNLMNGTQTIFGSDGITTVTPNLMGGYNIMSPTGFSSSSANVFGGQNIIGPTGGFTTTMPTLNGGYNVIGPSGGMTTLTPNLMGGFNRFP